MRPFISALLGLACAATPLTAIADFIPPPPPPPGPIISVPEDITVFTRLDAPVPVTFSVSATDPILNETPAVACEPASGYAFPVGEDTSVECTATNSAENSSTRSFMVSVVLDTTPPTITPPADQSFTVSSVPTIPALIVATALDDYDSAPVVTFSPESFPDGTTEVTWTATDAAGNSATTTSKVTIVLESNESDAGSSIEADISLPNGCVITDTTEKTHIFPATSSASEYLAICAVQTALEQGVLSSLAFQDFSWGLWLDSINGTTTSSDWSSYWALSLNDEYASVGIADLPLVTGDTLTLAYTLGDTVDTVTLHITSLDPQYANVVVPDSCSVADTDDTEHVYPADASPSQYLGVCALTDAKARGYIESFTFVNFDWGLWLDSIDGAATTADFSGFWALSHNGESASVGIVDLPVALGDTIGLSYTSGGVADILLRVIGLTHVTTSEQETPPDGGGGSGGGGGGGIVHTPFNVPNALAFLSSKQATTGSFGADFVTDWVALAFAASDPGMAKTKLRDYLKSGNPSMASTLDYERHAMALMALGVNPYDGTGVDYISPIVAAFDGSQIGSASLENDDIFGIIPLLKAGYSTSDTIIQKPVAFIVSRQASDGSWTGGVDMTAAAIQALTPLQSLPGVSDALTKAKAYLHSRQAGNGGFGNTPATGWAAQAIGALGETDSQWAPNGYYADDYLGSEQRADGGVDPASATDQNRIWNTAYAITGSLKRSWPSLLTSFTKPSATTGAGGGAAAGAASSTAPVATSTPLVATSTPVAEVDTFIATSTAEETEVALEPVAELATSIVRFITPPSPTVEMATSTALVATTTPTTTANLALAGAAETAVPWWAILLAILILLVVSYLFRRQRYRKHS